MPETTTMKPAAGAEVQFQFIYELLTSVKKLELYFHTLKNYQVSEICDFLIKKARSQKLNNSTSRQVTRNTG
jgi:hypothetical protein